MSKNKTEKALLESGKISLTLREDVYNLLLADITFFERESSNTKFTTFVNRIFANYHEDSPAAISARITARREELTHLGVQESKIKEDCSRLEEVLINEINELIYNYEFSVFNESRTFKIPVNMDNRDVFVDSNGRCRNPNLVYYGNQPSKFFKVVILSYLALPMHEREKIYFRDIVRDFEEAREKNNICEITENNEIYRIKPYKLLRGYGNNYCYLVGIIEDSDRIKVTRLSKVQKFKRTKACKYLSNMEEDYILKEIQRKGGVQYYSSTLETYEIRLTPSGYKMYCKVLYQRPGYKSCKAQEDGSYLMTIECTRFQFENYFLRFGEDMFILTPLRMRKRFKKNYEASLRHYEQEEKS